MWSLIIKLINNYIILWTLQNYGNGLPRAKPDKAHAPFWTKSGLFILSVITDISLETPPNFIILSLFKILSLAKFPIAHITCYTIASILLLRR
jgi:hypothetical protein